MKTPQAANTLRIVVTGAAVASLAGCAGWFGQDTSSTSAGESSRGTVSARQANAPSLAVSEDLVRSVQQQLRDRGVNAGPVDGIWGPETHQGLQKFQQSQGLQPTGQLDTATLQALGIMDQQGRTAASTSATGSNAQRSAAQGTSPAGSGSRTVSSDMPSFDRLDANGDGEVSLAESAVDTRVSNDFKRADQDGNGRLSRDEFQRALDMPSAPASGSAGNR
jgi:peptidoglycan hydrolase-like protein with peptidoglycan-binding domain